MAVKKSTTDSPPASQTPGDLAALAARLVEHAGTIRNPAAAKAMGDDMRKAAGVIDRLRTGIEEVIQHTKDDDLRARLAKLVEGA
jgi:hypothetical protein